MTAIDMLFIERNLQQERFRQKDNAQRISSPSLEGCKGKQLYRINLWDPPQRIKEKAAPVKHDQSSNFCVLWQPQGHSEITLKRYYLLRAQKMMMGIWSAVLVAGSSNGYSTLRQIFKSLPSSLLSPQFAAFPFSNVFTHLVSAFLSSGI